MTRNIVVFYDSPCIDGACSAWAVNEALREQPDLNVEYVPIGYGKPEERTQKILSHLHDGAEVIFVDTSPKDDTLDLLFHPNDATPKIKKLTVLDHHASEVSRMRQYERMEKLKVNGMQPALQFEFIVNEKKPSAAVMAWEYFHKDKPVPKLLEWVGKMEPPVKLKNDHEYAIAAFIDSKDIVSPKEVFRTIDDLAPISEEKMVSQGNAILAEQMNNINKGIKTSQLYTKLELLPGHTEWIPIVNANVQNFGRRVDEALLEEAYAGTTCGVSAAWFVQNDGTVKMSLRSRGTPDVGMVAQHVGRTIGVSGGGHAPSAVVQFADLSQFAANVKLYSKEKMIAEMWNGKALGPHTAAVRSNSEGAARAT